MRFLPILFCLLTFQGRLLALCTAGSNPPTFSVTSSAALTNASNPVWYWEPAGGDFSTGSFRYETEPPGDSDLSFGATTASITGFTVATSLSTVITLHVQEQCDNDVPPTFSSTASYTVTVDLDLPSIPILTGLTLTNDPTPTWTWSSGGGGAETEIFLYSLNDSDLLNNGITTGATDFTTSSTIASGIHTFYLLELDSANNFSPTSFFVTTVDLVAPQPPLVSGTSPINTNVPTWVITQRGGDGINVFRVKIDDPELETGAISVNQNVYQSASALSETTHTLYVQERDAAGNWSDASTHGILVDITAPNSPVVTAATPNKDGNPIWNWYSGGGGNGIYQYTLFTDTPSEFVSATSTTATSYTTSLPDDGYQFQISEFDDAGNLSVAGVSEISVDSTLPVAPTISGPTSPTSNNNVFWSWSSNRGESIFLYNVDDSNVISGQGSVQGSDTSTTVILSDGFHSIFVRDVDAGQTNPSATAFDQVEVDTSPPEPPLVSLVGANPTSNPEPTFTWVSGGNGGIGTFRYQLNDVSLSAPTQTTSLSFTVDGDLDEGENFFYVQERDSAGNWSTTGSAVVTVDVSVPEPSVSVSSPTSDQTPTITWSSGGFDGNGNFRYELSPPANGDLEAEADFSDTSTSFTTGTSLPEAAYIFHVQEQDNLGNWSDSTTAAIVIDFTAPESPLVTGVSPTNTGTPTWTWTSGGGVGNGDYRYKFEDSDLEVGATSTNSESFTTGITLTDGAYTLYVQESDEAGNWSTSGNFAITVDLTAPISPSVSITSPTSDSTPTWSWNPGGGGNGIYRYKIDDSSLVSGATQTNTTSFTTTATLSEGIHTLYVQERDNAGNWSVSGSAAVTVDTFVPAPVSLSVSSPTSDPTPVFSWSSGGVDGNGTFRYELSPPGDSDLSNGSTSVVATSFETLSDLSGGTYTLFVQERDALGNWSASASVAVTIDTTAPVAPTVSATSPVNTGTPSWSWTGDNSGDGIGLFRYKFEDPSFASGAVSTTSLTFTTSTSLGDGTYTLYVQERDSVGNWSTTGSTAVEVDLTPPTQPSVSITSPTSDTTPLWSWSTGGGGNGTYRFKLDDSSLDSGATQTVATSFEPSASLPEGAYILYVQEQDNAGNWSVSGSAPVTIDTFVPPPSVLGSSLTSSDPPTWFWSSGGPDGIGTFRYKVDDTDLSSGSTSTNSTSLTPGASLGEGPHTLYVQERDALQNWSESGSFSIVVDLTPPGAPSLGASTPTSSVRPRWSWTSGGGGVGTYRYKLDDADLSAGATLVLSESFLPGFDLSEAAHTLYVQERDDAGNWSSSGSFVIVVDLTSPNAPSVSGSTPTTDQTPLWTWSSGGGGGNGVYRFKLDNSDLTVDATVSTTTNFTASLGVDNGPHILYVQERDDAQNWSDSGLFTITVESGAPNTPLVTGVDETSSTQPTWNWVSGGGGGNGTFRFKLDDPDLTIGSIQSVATSFTATLALPVGQHTLYVQEQGDSGLWSATGFFTTTIDTSTPTAPSVTGVTPTTSLLPSWNWAGAGGGDGTFRYKFEDSSLESGAISTSALSFTTATTLPEGTYTLYVQEQNFEGIWSSNGSFAISVDLTVPLSPSVSAISPTTLQNPFWSWSSGGGGGNGTYRYELDDIDLSAGATITSSTGFISELGLDDGIHTLYVQERDLAGNWSVSGSFAVTVQSGAPNAPSVSAVLTSTDLRPTWSWTSGGNGGNGTFRYRLDDSDLQSASAQTIQTSFTPLFDLTEGLHTLYVQEENTTGQWSSSGSSEVQVDKSPPGPPSVSGTTPSSDATPLWSWSSTGGGNGTFRYKFEDSDLETGAVSTTLTTFTTSLDLSDGTFSLYVQERDEAGNFSGTGTFSIEVDTSAPNTPSVTATSPQSIARVVWNWTSGGGGNGIFRYKLNDSDLSSGATLNAGLGYTEPVALSEGVHILYVQERDDAGNWSASATEIATIDTVVPASPVVTGPISSSSATPTWIWTGDQSGDGLGIFRYKLDESSLASGAIVTTSLEFTPSVSLSDGTHTLYVQERDFAQNWSQSGSFTILVDALIPPAPSVDGSSLTSNARPGWTWTGDLGSDGVGTFRFKLDDSSLESGATTTVSTGFTSSTSLSDGGHILYVQEQDGAGNWSLSGSFLTTVDTTPPIAPSVSADSPTSNSAPTWSWTGDSSGDGIGEFRYKFEDSSLDSGAVSTSATNFTTAQTLPDGFYQFFVQERDLIGNWSGSGSFVLEIDTQPPSAPGITGSTITNLTLPVWTLTPAGGGNGTYRLDLVVSGSCDPARQTALITTNTYTPDAPLNDGTYTFCAQERDDAGNWSATDSFQTEVDTSIPGSPSVSGPAFTVQLQPEWSWAPGGGGNGTYRISLDDEAFSSPTTLTETSFTPSSPLSEGTHVLYVQERNNAGTWSLSGSFQVVIDLTAPSSPIVNSVTLTNLRQPTWTWVSGGGGNGVYRFNLDNGDFTTQGIQTTNDQFTPIVPLADGNHTLFVQERDDVGNWSSSGSFQVTIDGTAPNPPSVSGITPQSSTTPLWLWVSGGGGNGTFRYRLDNADLSNGSVQSTTTSFQESFGLEDGPHTLYVQEIDDAENWSVVGSFTILIESGLPNSPIVDGEKFSTDGIPTWTWTSGGASGSGIYRYKLNDSNLQSGATQTSALSFSPSSTLGEGAHILYVQEQNSAGNWSVPGFFSTIVDLTLPQAPSVTATSPTSNRLPTWSWTSGGGGVGVYRYELNDSDLSTGSLVVSTGEFTPQEELFDGIHTLYVQERDDAGNWGATGDFAVEVDTLAPNAPSVTGITPLVIPSPTWNWSSGGGGNGTYRIKIDSEDLSVGALVTTALSFTELLGLNDGAHTLYVQERDEAENWSGSGSFEITVQTGAPDHPIVAGLSPTNEVRPVWSWISGESGGNGVYRYLLNSTDFDSQGTQTIETSFQPSQDLSDGVYTLYVQEQNNGGQWSVPGLRIIEVDTSLPSAPIVTGPFLTNLARPIFTWNSTDGSGEFRLLVNSTSFDDSTPLTTATLFQPSSDLSDGFHTLNVQERDAAGNWSLNGSFTSEVDLTPPSPPSVSSSSTATDPNPFFEWIPGGGGNGIFRFKLDDTDLDQGATEVRDLGFIQFQGLVNGNHTLYVQERDNAGNWSSSGNVTILIQSGTASPPLVTALTPTNDQTPLWSWNPGPGGNQVFRVRVDNADLEAEFTIVQAQLYSPPSPLADGEHTLYVQEQNSSGQWSATGFFTLVIDTGAPLPPTVRATTPTSDTQLQFTFESGGGGNGTFRYEIANAILDDDSPTTSSTSLSVPTTLADGVHSLYVQERDAAGNWSQSGEAEVEIDTTPPQAPIVSGESVVAQSRPTWTWSSGGGGIGIFRYRLNFSDLTTGATVSSSVSFSPLQGLNDGFYTLYVQERDLAGNWSGSGTFNIEIDTGAPNAPVVSGPQASNFARPTWTWISAADDGDGTFRYRLDNPDLNSQAVETSLTSFTPLSNLSEGRHTLYVQEKNSLGLWSVNGLFTIDIDTAAPNSPSVGGTSPTSDVTPTWTWVSTGGGDGNYRLKLDNSDLSQGSTSTSSNSFTPSPLVDGNHTLYVQERDEAGNFSDSGLFIIRVDTTPPGAPSVTSTAVSTTPDPVWTWASTGNGVAIFRYKLDDSDLSSGSSVTTQTSFQEPFGLDDGNYTLYVQERDEVGNWSASGSFTLLIQTNLPHSPSVSAVTPTSSLFPTWVWEAVGTKGNGTFRYEVDDKDLSSGAKVTSTTSFTPIIGLSEGKHSLYVEEQNADGEWSVSGFFEVEIDSTPPTPPKVSGPSQTNDDTPTWSWIPRGESNEVYRYKLETFLGTDLSGGFVQTTDRSFTPATSLSEDTYALFVQQVDLSGNWSDSEFFFITINQSIPNAPSVVATFSVTNDNTPEWSWFSGDVDGSGSYRYRIDLDNFLTSGFEQIILPANQFGTDFSPGSPLEDGFHNLFVQEQNVFLTWSPSGAAGILVDTIPPQSTISPVAGIYNQELDLTVGCSDDSGSGCFSSFLTTSSKVPTLSSTPLAGSFRLSSSSTATYFSLDSAGNSEDIQTAVYVLDFAPPTVLVSPLAGIYQPGQEIVLECQDTIGCLAIYFTTNGSTPNTSSQTYSGPLTLNSDLTLSLFGGDLAGNHSTLQSLGYEVDSTSPVVLLSREGGSYEFGFLLQLTCSDDRSIPCRAVHLTRDGTVPNLESDQYDLPLAILSDTTLGYFAVDSVGNIGLEGSVTYSVPQFSLNTDRVFLTPGESVSLNVLGADRPKFNLEAGASGSIQANGFKAVTYTAPQVSSIDTLLVTDVIANTLVANRATLRTLSNLSVSDSVGNQISSTIALNPEGLELVPAGGSGTFNLRQVGGPGASLQITQPIPGRFFIKSLRKGAYAGFYRLRLEDPVSKFHQELIFEVGLDAITPQNNLLEGASGTVVVLGGTSEEIFNATILRGGTFSVASPGEGFLAISAATATQDETSSNPATFTLFPVETSEITSYVIRVQSTTRPSLQRVLSPVINVFPSQSYQGRVLDVSGQPISGAIIRSRDLRDEQGSHFFSSSDNTGNFDLRLLQKPFGRYHLVAEAQGFIPQVIDGNSFQNLEERKFFSTIRMNVANVVIEVIVQGLDLGDEAEVFGLNSSNSSAPVLAGPFFVTGGGTGQDSLNLLLDSHDYTEITARSENYLSTSVPFDEPDGGVVLNLSKPATITVSETINSNGSLILRYHSPGVDLSLFQAQAFDTQGNEVTPFNTARGQDLEVGFQLDQDLFVILKDGSGNTRKVWNHTSNPVISGLPGGAKEVEVEGGFRLEFPADQSVEGDFLKSISIELPPGGINSALTGDLTHASVQVATRSLSKPNNAAAALGQRVLEVRLDLLDSSGQRLFLGEGNRVLRDLKLTIPFDGSQIAPGDLETGRMEIWFAPQLSDFEALSITPISPENIIEIDYLNNRVTFTVDHLTVFAIGQFQEPPPGQASAQSPVSGCFIATAAFGSPDHWAVEVLTRFRDETLLESHWGRNFVETYYHYSPPLASWISRSFFRSQAAFYLLLPITFLLWFWNLGSFLGLLMLVLGFGFFLARKRAFRLN